MSSLCVKFLIDFRVGSKFTQISKLLVAHGQVVGNLGAPKLSDLLVGVIEGFAPEKCQSFEQEEINLLYSRNVNKRLVSCVTFIHI